MTFLTTTEQIAAFCQRLRGAPFITIDTEFMRERTYWPKLCLVQVAGPDLNDPAQVAAIDPLAGGDLAPLLALLRDPATTKVFHAARQDVEIFFNLMGDVPAPMFDTQVAAMVCGFGEAASYETLAGKLADAKIDKSSRFTDWAARPLTPKQVDYALADVTHLRVVYEKLKARITAEGRESWLGDEMKGLTDPATYRMDPDESWRRMKLRNEKPMVMAQVRALTTWRERVAQTHDIPRQRVLRDEALMEIAHHPVRDTAALARIRGLSQGFAEGKHGQDILALVAATLAAPVERSINEPPTRHLPNNIGSLVDLLKVLLKHISEQHGVAAKLLATVDDLEQIAAFDDAAVPALSGWRYEMFGKHALELKQGRLALMIDQRVVRLVPVRRDASTQNA